jgi:hypothetical protein
MKQKQMRFWGILAVTVAASIVITRPFTWPRSTIEANPLRTAAAEALAGDGVQPDLRAPDDIVPASAFAAPPGPPAGTPDAFTNAAPLTGEKFGQFRDWLSRYQQETDVTSKAVLEAEGEALALERREAMARLIMEDPQRALEEAIPFSQRQQLPEFITQHLEQTVSGRGNLGVLGVLPEPEAEGQIAGINRTVQLNGQVYRAFVYGRRLSQTTIENIPLHGIAIGDALALSESPVRVLDAAEAAARASEIAPENAQCPVSKQPISVENAGAVVDVGGQVRILCSGGHIQVLEGQLLAAEGAGSGTVAASGSLDSWSQGTRTLLYIRVRFSDQTADPQTLADSQTMLTNVDSFFREGSYETTTIVPTFTPVYVLPYDTAYYVSNDIYAVRNDALAAAKAGGYDSVNWNLDAVRYNGGPGAFSGAAYVRARGCWLKSSSAGVASHEFGHNYGLWHANSWNPSDESPIGPGAWQEYGDSFDTMGAAGAGAYHYNPRYKSVLNWIAPDGFLTASNTGTYRIYAHDFVTSSNFMRGLCVPRSSANNYWVDFRQQFTGNTWLMNGAGIRRADNANNNNPGGELLDMTPGSQDGKTDSALLIGRTFSDRGAGVHITPIGKGGTAPESLDVVVNLGSFPGNAAPTLNITASATAVPVGTPVTFTANAGDANGDTLAYHWDFDDKTYGLNTTTPAKSWSVAGEYVVRCVVSDMKGGTASHWIVITVGSPSTFRISGRVTDGSGNPVEGVRVHNGKTGSIYRGCCTDSDGNYCIVGLTSGSYTVGAACYGAVLAPSGFVNPLTVGPSRTGVNFVATPKTYSLSGRVTDGGVGVADVQVTDGIHSTIANSNGDFTINNVPNGNYTLTATKTGYSFLPSGFANPITVADANLANLNFVTPTYNVSGEITGVAVTTIVTVTDGYRSTTSYKQGSGSNVKNVFTLSGVPAGSWNLRAILPGSSFSPANFSNPLLVTNNTSSRNFALDATATYSISGIITYSGAGLAGVTVSAGSRNSVTDSRGGFYILGLSSGTYNVVPSLSGYGFSPVNTSATISGANVSGQNFTATQVVAPNVTLTASDADASESGGNMGSFTVTRTGSTASDITVLYSVSGTASPGADYSALSGSVTIPAGASSANITVAPINDATAECSETVVATLVANAAYTIAVPNTGTVTISDDDFPVVSIVALDASVSENSAGAASLRVSRTGCLNGVLTVNYTVSGSATAGQDYQALSGAVTIPANTNAATVTVAPMNDSVSEGDETVVITIASSASYITGLPNSASITIVDDEANHAPLVNAGPDQTFNILGLANLNGTVTDDGRPSGALSYEWVKISGPGTAVASNPNAEDTSVCFSMPGVYVFRLTSSDGELSASDDVAITIEAADPAKVLNAVNAGGPAYTDAQGIVYHADTWFAAGNANSSTAGITATADGALYQTERAGDFTYHIPVSGGSRTYWVALKFAETTATTAGQRVFDVLVDGSLVLDNLDILGAFGANVAFDVVMAVTTANDALSIQFRTEAGSALPAKVDAIVVGAAQVLSPAAPSDFTATAATSSRIDLSWSDNSANETGFQIDVSTDGSTFVPLATVGANATSYSHTGLNPATTYYYRVRACNAAGCSAFATANEQTGGAPPAAPSNLTAVAQAGSQIKLSWVDNSSNEDGFVIERSLNGTAFQVIYTTGPNVTTFTNAGLQTNTRYYFRVRAFNVLGYSAYSNTANARTKQR